MCEIQLIKVFDKKNLEQQDREVFHSLMMSGSIYNKDAYGIFNGDKTYKEGKSFQDIPLITGFNLIKKYGSNKNFLMGHNRLTTQGSGKNNKNNHPFESKDFVLMHNGVISNDSNLSKMKELFYKGDTDSIIILELIQALKDKGYGLLDSIKKTAEVLEGSYSVLLYHKETKNLYYFKNKSTKFTFALVKQGKRRILLGSTDNKNFLSIYNKQEMIFKYSDYDSYKEVDAKSGVIYRITDEDISEVKEFTPKVTHYISGYNGYCDDYGVDKDYYGYTTNTNYKGETLTNLVKEVEAELNQSGYSFTKTIDFVEKSVHLSPNWNITEEDKKYIYEMFDDYIYWDKQKNAFIMSERDILEWQQGVEEE